MPHCRRFLGVNSVTNIEPGGGFLPVPIIRNEYWFEKFCVTTFPIQPPFYLPSATGEKVMESA
ncbi:hypothetical protein NTG44_20920 [Pseudomonas sp. 20P_3.2_Bac4]|nr:hypothetical protein [Pseudomonas sp. Irchel 3E13]MCU1719934.1 hypothetical protein [Pseudomonas sp. 5P_5.1_Bac1]MCU1734160.1 hypothetical protein [Pseudomonas sp. 20P_3.2_Bac4]MCU1742821.1 hypothetical protein [Pseudomonas sp. 20P_3.2_Bac5]